MHRVPVSVFIVTGALLINCLLAIGGGPDWLMRMLSLAGPFLIFWMVMDVLTDRTAPVRDLDDDEEWGYVDRPDLRPRRQR
jgi:hypothetical protein